MTTTPDEALRDPNLLGAALGADASSWATWLAVLRAAFGLKLDDADRATFATVAGDREPPTKRVQELWAVCGRRSGKTRTASAIATHIAAIEKHTLAPGEVGYVLVLSASRAQAGLALSYILAFLEKSPILRQQIENVTSDEIKLKGNVVIGVGAASHRTSRGFTLLAVIADETAQWRSEDSAVPDVETYRAVMPSLAASGGMFIGISTGYRKIGLLYSKWKQFFGVASDDVLVVSGSSEQFNLLLSSAMVQRAMAADPESADAEWGGKFRNDIAAFLDEGTIEDAISYGRPLELPPRAGVKYVAFVDPSGGRHDDYAVCIAHRESETSIVADVVTGVHPPFDPLSVTKDFAALLKEYHVSKAIGDHYSAEWVVSAFRDNGITYECAELSKSEIYLESLPMWSRGTVLIPDHPKLLRELRLLERHTHRSGRDSVDHGRNGSDDYANALCGAFVLAKKGSYDIAALAEGLPRLFAGIESGVVHYSDGTGVSDLWLNHPEIINQTPRRSP